MAKRVEVLMKVVFTLHNGDTIELQDEPGKLVAKKAFADFMGYRIIECITSDTETTYVPFHSVLKAVVTEERSESEFEDDTCVTASDESDEGTDEGNGENGEG